MLFYKRKTSTFMTYNNINVEKQDVIVPREFIMDFIEILFNSLGKMPYEIQTIRNQNPFPKNDPELREAVITFIRQIFGNNVIDRSFPKSFLIDSFNKTGIQTGPIEANSFFILFNEQNHLKETVEEIIEKTFIQIKEGRISKGRYTRKHFSRGRKGKPVHDTENLTHESHGQLEHQKLLVPATNN